MSPRLRAILQRKLKLATRTVATAVERLVSLTSTPETPTRGVAAACSWGNPSSRRGSQTGRTTARSPSARRRLLFRVNTGKRHLTLFSTILFSIHHFFSFPSLRIHFYDNHLSEEEKIFECEYCDKRFALRTMRNKHVKQIHEKSHSCDYCGEFVGYAQTSSL